MAGRARAKALADELARRTADYFELSDAIAGEETTHTTLDYVADWVESGNTLKELAASLTTTLEHEVTYARLMATLREEHGAGTVEERLDASRARASHSLAEHALELVDAKADTNVEVSRAASRARTRQWMAERYNPSKYGQSKGVSVSVSVGSLHLDALRHLSTIVTPASQHALPSPAHNSDELAQVIE
jgi:hypothetical protein